MAAYKITGPFYFPDADPIDGGTMCLVKTRAPNELTTTSASADPVTALPPSKLKMSTVGIKLLKDIESSRLKPYDDQTGKDTDVWTKGATIGYGHLIPKSQWDTYKSGITEDQSRALFDQDLPAFVGSVRAEIKVPLKQNQFDALCIFAFNLGPAQFSHSSALRLVNDPAAHTSYRNLEAAWKAFNKSEGKVNKGVANRRNCEWNVYSQGIYKRW